MLHSRPRHVKTTLEIKNFIQDNLNCSVSEIFHQIQENHINGYENITVQQTYYWWSIESHKTYCRDPDPLLIFTVLFYQLLYNKFDAIEIDATYNTNNLAWELYAIMGVIDVDASFKRTKFKRYSTDKDFAEINAAQTVWPEAHLQLCVWHIQRAIKQRLSSNKTSSYHSYNPKIAHEECSTIDPNWGIVNNSNSGSFCLLNLRETVINLIKDHSNRHMLLPKLDGIFTTNADEI
ncbi:unnamed protein product [Rhizophagus irregularis]|nr:unnamed protein product [Rhizophagus irregularis]